MRLSRRLLWLVLILFSCDEDETTETPGKFYAVSEIHQVGYANETSAHPMAVRVLNTDGIPMEGVSVNFAVLNGVATLQNNITVA